MTITALKTPKMVEETPKRNGKGNGDSRIHLDETIFHSKLGRYTTLDYRANEIVVLRPHGAVIEFLGMPKGGKSKQIEMLIKNLKQDEEFSGLQIELFKPNTAAKMLFAKETDRGLFHENIVWDQINSLAKIHSRIKNKTVPYREVDLAIFDRGVIDSLVWTEVLFRRGDLNPRQRAYLNAMTGEYETRINLAIGMNVTPEEAMRREGEKAGTVMNQRSLEQLFMHYMMLDFMNDQERATIIGGEERYAPFIQDLTLKESERPNYYGAFKLENTNYLGIECKICETEEEKRRDLEGNAAKIYSKVAPIVRARLQEHTSEA